MVPLQGYLAGSVIFNADLARTACHIRGKDASQSMGLYNLSVWKLANGYRGIIRGFTWNGCCAENISPPFSYPYEIQLDNNGNVQ